MGERSLNKVELIGRLGKDPEVRYTSSGRAVANFSMATGESWKDESGEVHERTEWHNIVMWGNLAEVAGEYLKKGNQAFVTGKKQTREWEDQDGNKRQTVEIVVNDLIMLGGKSDGEGNSRSSSSSGRSSSNRPSGSSSRTAQAPKRQDGKYAPPPPEDDIPF